MEKFYIVTEPTFSLFDSLEHQVRHFNDIVANLPNRDKGILPRVETREKDPLARFRFDKSAKPLFFCLEDGFEMSDLGLSPGGVRLVYVRDDISVIDHRSCINDCSHLELPIEADIRCCFSEYDLNNPYPNLTAGPFPVLDGSRLFDDFKSVYLMRSNLEAFGIECASIEEAKNPETCYLPFEEQCFMVCRRFYSNLYTYKEISDALEARGGDNVYKFSTDDIGWVTSQLSFSASLDSAFSREEVLSLVCDRIEDRIKDNYSLNPDSKKYFSEVLTVMMENESDICRRLREIRYVENMGVENYEKMDCAFAVLGNFDGYQVSIDFHNYNSGELYFTPLPVPKGEHYPIPYVYGCMKGMGFDRIAQKVYNHCLRRQKSLDLLENFKKSARSIVSGKKQDSKLVK